MWELDWNADGKQDMSGQGIPACQVTYEIPGSYTPTFVFYNDFSEVIARASCTVTVAAETEGETGTQHQALKYTPRGGGGSDFGAGGLSSPLPAIDPQKLDDGPSNWVAPREEITDDLDPELYLFPERGSAPLTVRFDARDTFARYGVRAYNYDVVWGPNEEPDDGYYEQSGPDPRWTRTFEEYGLYKVILDVEDGLGKTSRTTRVIAVTSPGKSPHAKIAANVTKGYAPLVVLFQANQASLALENQAIYAFWDFDTNSLERPFGGDLGAYGTVVHTYQVPGKYTAGVILTDIDDNAGPMATVAIEVLAKEEDNGPKG
jgi:PKD repeat protein